MSGLFGGGTNIKAPIIASVRIQTSAFGRCVPLVYGQTRVAGCLMWYNDFKAHKHKKKSGKGGGTTQTSYTYTCAVEIGLCEGEILGVSRVWQDKNVVTLSSLGLDLYTGTSLQAAYPYIVTNHPDQAISYRYQAYVATGSYNLGTDAQMPQHNFEVTGLLPYETAGEGPNLDAVPSDVMYDFLTDPIHGAGFPSDKIGDLTEMHDYCVASNLFISPAYTEQAPAAETIAALAKLANCALVYSSGVLKSIPFCDSQIVGNGATYSPNVTPVYALTDDDFIASDGNDPVIVTRNKNADAYNQVQVKYYNRENSYAEDVVEASDQRDIELFGLRSMQPVDMYQICRQATARNVAQILMQRSLYIRNKYKFSLSWKYCLLEPMDIVTLTESTGTGLDNVPVRITSVEEGEDGELSIEAEDFLGEVSSIVAYPSQPAGGYVPNYNVPGGNATATAILEPPAVLGGGFQLLFGAAGGELWGGADVYVSTDGSSYSMLGTVESPARIGKLVTSLASVADPDTTSTLSVDMTASLSELSGGTQADADSYNTLCCIGDEWLSFETATLTDSYKYDLTYLRRGAYSSTISAHDAASKFVRVDADAFLQYAYTPDRIGKYIYVKFLSYNIYNSGYQQLSDVDPIMYRITGASVTIPLPNVSGVMVNFVAGLTQISWDRVVDFRDPNVDYEVRIGATWETASIVGRTPNTNTTATSAGTYWITAHYLAGTAKHIYSAAPVDVVISSTALTSNVIASYEEASTGWSGTVGAGLTVASGEIYLSSGSTGTYTNPSGHTVTLADVANCSVMISYSARGQSVDNNFLTISNVFDIVDLLEYSLGTFVNVLPQIAIADGSGTYGAWTDYRPGTYTAKHFKSRFILSTTDATVVPYVDSYTFAVDVPDHVESGSLTTATGGTSVTYATVYNVAPNVQITIASATAGDDILLTSQTTTGFTVQVVNGAGVARSINWIAQGY
jgi:hypothetical protein